MPKMTVFGGFVNGVMFSWFLIVALINTIIYFSQRGHPDKYLWSKQQGKQIGEFKVVLGHQILPPPTFSKNGTRQDREGLR